MKIENLRREKEKNRVKVAATVRWEDCDRPVQELYFETDEGFAADLSCNPHAFMLACAIPAMHYGEERIFLDAEICPELRDGLIIAMGWFHHWFGLDFKPVRIEARIRASMPTPRTPERAGFFFSGGIDSLATLRVNRLNFPSEHPWSIKDGLLVYGLELDEPEAFEHVLHSLSVLAREVGITLVPIYTNVYLDYRQEDASRNFSFWKYKFQAAALAAVAHVFARRLTIVSIAATFDIPNFTTNGHLRAFGSHPLIDHNYSSSDLMVRDEGVALSRFDKVKLVADWDVVLKNLRVCNQYKRYQSGRLNCGKCEKCIRTMLSLLAMGVLDKTRAFPHHDVSEEIVRKTVSIPGQYVEACYKDLIAPLTERGRLDLVEAIEDSIANYHQSQWKAKWRQRIVDPVAQFDEKYFHNCLRKLKNLLRA